MSPLWDRQSSSSPSSPTVIHVCFLQACRAAPWNYFQPRSRSQCCLNARLLPCSVEKLTSIISICPSSKVQGHLIRVSLLLQHYHYVMHSSAMLPSPFLRASHWDVAIESQPGNLGPNLPDVPSSSAADLVAAPHVSLANHGHRAGALPVLQAPAESCLTFRLLSLYDCFSLSPTHSRFAYSHVWRKPSS